MGQTAVHLAAKNGSDDILKTLLENNASVFCRDTAGYTPLHVSLTIIYIQIRKNKFQNKRFIPVI